MGRATQLACPKETPALPTSVYIVQHKPFCWAEMPRAERETSNGPWGRRRLGAWMGRGKSVPKG